MVTMSHIAECYEERSVELGGAVEEKQPDQRFGVLYLIRTRLEQA